MLSMDEKKKFLRMAISCLNNENETDHTLKKMNSGKPVPTKEEDKSIKEGLQTGKISDELLKKFFKMAYDGSVKNGVYSHFFDGHNRYLWQLVKAGKIDKETADWCTARPGRIKGINGSNILVETDDGETISTSAFVYNGISLVDKSKVVEGAYVANHRGKIHMILSDVDYKTASKFYKKFKKESEI